MSLRRACIRYAQLFLQPIPSHLDWIGRAQMVITGLLLLGISLASFIQSVGEQINRVPGGTIAVILTALLALSVVAGVRLALELDGARRNLSLYFESGGLAETKDIIHGSEHAVYHVGDLLIINTGISKVLLRIRIRIPVCLGGRRVDWDAEEEIIYAQAQCVRGGIRLASEVGEVPHLRTEIELPPESHARGHTELLLDLRYMKHNYGQPFQQGEAQLEVEDILSKQVKLIEVWPFDPLEDTGGAEAQPSAPISV